MVGKDIRLKRPQSTCKGENIDSCEHTGVDDQTCGEDMQLCYKKWNQCSIKAENGGESKYNCFEKGCPKKRKPKSTCYNTER